MAKTIRNKFDKYLIYSNLMEAHKLTAVGKTKKKDVIIFNLKNNFGWTDKQQVEHSGNINNPFEGLSTEELRQLINDDKH